HFVLELTLTAIFSGAQAFLSYSTAAARRTLSLIIMRLSLKGGLPKLSQVVIYSATTSALPSVVSSRHAAGRAPSFSSGTPKRSESSARFGLISVTFIRILGRAPSALCFRHVLCS